MRKDNIAALGGTTLQQLEIALDLHTREQVEVTPYTAFSWSVSRHSTFQRCKRQYYLNYYGTRRVREANNAVISAVWWLKQVTSLRTWIGTVVHRMAQTAVTALQAGREVGEQELVEQAIDFYHAGIEASKRGTKHGNEWRVLFEDVYPGDPYSIDRNEAEVLVVDLTRTLLDSDAYAFIHSQPCEAIKEIDPPFQSFTLRDVPRLGGVRVFAIPDVLLSDVSTVTIVDWKTGDVEHEGIRDQAGVYRMYAHMAYHAPEEAIHVAIADLSGSGESVDPPGGTPGVAEAEAFARGSIAEMVGLMEDPAYNTASIKRFPMTDNLALCRQCGFKRACWRHEAAHE